MLKEYKQWPWGKLISEQITKEQILALDGKNLVCYCAPLQCHGNAIVDAIKWIKANPLALDEAIITYKKQQEEKQQKIDETKYVVKRSKLS